MKKITGILILIVTSCCCVAQNITDRIHPLFAGEIDGDLIREQFQYTWNSFNSAADKSEHRFQLVAFFSNALVITGQLGHEKIPALKKYETGSSAVYESPSGGYVGKYGLPIFDSIGIIVTVSGINQQNAGDYEWRVVKDETKEIIPWRAFTLFCQAYMQRIKKDGTEDDEVAYLGQFRNNWGSSLTFEIKKKNDPLITGQISALWVNRSPAVLGVFGNEDMAGFLSVFKKQWQHDSFVALTPAERMAKDSLLVLRHAFKPGDNNLLFYLDDKVRSKEIIEYRLIAGNDSSEWKVNDFDLNLVWLKGLAPGRYTLLLRYSLQRQNIASYSFSIAAGWHQTILFKVAVALLLLAGAGLIIQAFRARRHKQRLLLAQVKKQQVEAELKSIRAQFNPHFVFNALGSIQGLITRNDMEAANHYLSEFSTLLRDSLKEAGKEQVSLATEIKMLDTYLQLEKLRFGFTYTIDTDKEIDLHAVEIPALILQPLVENAVKHGIAALYEKGRLSISFKKENTDLFATITDNGPGFSAAATLTGYGLKITKERISLLNSVLPGQSIELLMPAAEGTIVSLQFKNWLS